MVSDLTDNKSKRTRNRIAGYMNKNLSPKKKRRNIENYESNH
jgi:ribosomal protein S17E